MIKKLPENHKSIMYAYIRILFFLVVIIVGCIIYKEKNKVLLENTLTVQLPVFNVITSEASDKDTGASNLVSWWHSEDYNKYYLFLPAHAENKSLQVILATEYTILWNGTEIENGQCIEIEPGDYCVEEVETNQTYQVTVMQSENVGTIYLETDSGTIEYLEEVKGNEESGKITILDSNGEIEYSGGLEYIRGRGNDTWTEDGKKSYQIQLEYKEDLFQMGSNRTWVLLSNTSDLTQMKNGIAFDMATDIGLDFTPDAVWMDVYINGIYMGTYQMTEKVEIDENRVDINNLEEETIALNSERDLTDFERFMNDEEERLYSAKGFEIENNPEDITGGYLLEIELSDRYGVENSGFITARGQAVVIISPENASREQVEYISQLYQEMEDAIYSDDGKNPYTDKYYTDYLDLESFSSKYIIEETVKNLDSAFTSQYIYKYPDEVSDKFYAGPVWDYDKSMGVNMISEEIDLSDPYTFYVNEPLKESSIWYGLYQQGDFRDQVQEIYANKTSVYLSECRESIEILAEKLEPSIMMNIMRWNQYPESGEDEKSTRYYESVEKVILFLENRKIFLDTEWINE